MDSPRAIITTCMLNGDNYDMWEKAMVTANVLRAKNKLGFIDKSLRKPNPDTLEASVCIAWSDRFSWATRNDGNDVLYKVPNCTCGAHDFFGNEKNEKLHQFLMGFNDAVFGTIRSQVLNLDLLPIVNKTYAMIIKEERYCTMTRGQADQIEAIVMTVTTLENEKGFSQYGPNQHGNTEKICSNCCKSGHDVADCFETNGS
ncbi:UNVERIFIED_CONTAM: hypothetical protein Sradi_6534100 [Sesamum radiatum]|uniref:Retrotransposon Copia-like N-terminal domain-containing protein n=1 Tax=Sesamum radiatum TaxID=300843 RepID=A0AAW2JX41_SESRA